MTDLSALSPVEIDTKLSALWEEQQRYEAWLASAMTYLAREQARNGRLSKIEDYEVQVERYKGEVERIKAAARPYEIEFQRRPWKRYFLVTNSNGHVHRGMSCGTCYPSTQYAWLIELADCDEAKMVEEFGEKACTVCFPDAPAIPAFHAPGRRDREVREARAAEKAQKAQEKASKAITDVDGSPLRVPGGYGVLATKVAAQRALSQAVQDYRWYGPSHSSRFFDQITHLIRALSAAGIDPQPIIERASKKAERDARGGRALTTLPEEILA